MDAQAFSSLLRKPSLLKNYSLSELQQLAHQYPYAFAIHALIAMKAYRENNRSYEHYLHQAAIRVPDRKRLYHLIHAGQDETGIEIPEHTDLAPPAGAIIEAREKILPPDEAKSPEPESHKGVAITDDRDALIKKKQQESRQEDDGRQEALELPGTEEAVKVLRAMSETERQLQTEPPAGKKNEAAAVIELSESHQYSFTEWLSFLKKRQKETMHSPVLREMQQSAESDEPGIIPQKTKLSEKEEAELARKARESLSDDMEWVTETLAKIYELQKKYDKAAEAYRMLSLKYPDKKAYFAQRIENLKKLKS